MKTLFLISLAAATLSLLPVPAEGETTYLDATFDDKAIGEPIGMAATSEAAASAFVPDVVKGNGHIPQDPS